MSAENAPGQLRVLVVDDRRDAALLLKAVLVRAGHLVTTAGDGHSGLEAARTFSPHAIISDIALSGGLSGFDFVRAVRSERPLPAKNLIAVTGHDDDEYRRLAQDAGFGHYLVKPAPVDQLLSILVDIGTPD